MQKTNNLPREHTKENAGPCLLKLRVIPNARKSGVVGLMEDGETWRVRLAAPPVDSKANELLVRWLAEALGIHRRQVRLVAGEKSREKRVAIEGVAASHVLAKLQEIAGG